jgi:hypothetical protein
MATKIEGYIDEPLVLTGDSTGLICSVMKTRWGSSQRSRCVTLVVHDTDWHERVYTEAEVSLMLRELMDELEDQTRYQGQTEVINASVMRKAFLNRRIGLRSSL